MDNGVRSEGRAVGKVDGAAVDARDRRPAVLQVRMRSTEKGSGKRRKEGRKGEKLYCL